MSDSFDFVRRESSGGGQETLNILKFGDCPCSIECNQVSLYLHYRKERLVADPREYAVIFHRVRDQLVSVRKANSKHIYIGSLLAAAIRMYHEIWNSKEPG
jgi:hypothetical protein